MSSRCRMARPSRRPACPCGIPHVRCAASRRARCSLMACPHGVPPSGGAPFFVPICPRRRVSFSPVRKCHLGTAGRQDILAAHSHQSCIRSYVRPRSNAPPGKRLFLRLALPLCQANGFSYDKPIAVGHCQFLPRSAMNLDGPSTCENTVLLIDGPPTFASTPQIRLRQR